MKKLFKFWGKVWWIDQNDKSRFFFIPENKAVFRWTSSEKQAKTRLKRLIQTGLKEQNEYPRKLFHILLHDTIIEEIKDKKVIAQRQLTLFPKTKKRAQ